MSMVKFYAKPKKDRKKQRIWWEVNIGGTRIGGYTNVYYELDELKRWDKRKQRWKERNNDEYEGMNTTLKATEAGIKKVYNKLVEEAMGGLPDPEAFRASVKEFLGGKNTTNPMLQSITEKAEEMGFNSGYQASFNMWKKFEDYQGKQYRFQDWNKSLYRKFCTFLFEVEIPRPSGRGLIKKKAGYGSVNTYLSHIRQIMRDLEIVPIKSINKWRGFKWESTQVSLEMDELHSLLALQFDPGSMEARTRDYLASLCLTGQRKGDIGKLMRARKGDKFLRKVMSQKTNTVVLIPIHPLLRPILDRYEGRLPTVTDYTVRAYLPEVVKMAGINDLIQVKDSEGGEVEFLTKQKWELVGTHTGRRTFATLAYFEWRLPVKTIMLITGHSTESEFYKYIRMSDRQKREEMERVALAWEENPVFSTGL